MPIAMTLLMYLKNQSYTHIKSNLFSLLVKSIIFCMFQHLLFYTSSQYITISLIDDIFLTSNLQILTYYYMFSSKALYSIYIMAAASKKYLLITGRMPYIYIMHFYLSSLRNACNSTKTKYT